MKSLHIVHEAYKEYKKMKPIIKFLRMFKYVKLLEYENDRLSSIVDQRFNLLTRTLTRKQIEKLNVHLLSCTIMFLKEEK